MRCSTLDLTARAFKLARCSGFLALCVSTQSLAATPSAKAPSEAQGSAQGSAQPESPKTDQPNESLQSQGSSAASSGSPSSDPTLPATSTVAPSPSKNASPESGPSQSAEPLVGTPLPPPPPSLPAAKIARGTWRGTVRLDAALNWSLPLPTSGTHRASGDLFGFGAELGASIRVLSSLGLGLRWAVSPHQNLGPNADLSWLFDARSANRLMLTARGYWPSKGRLQPFAEVAGGLLYLNAFAEEPAERGGSWSASAGLDGLILPGWTLWGALRYRGAYLYDELGHRVEVALGASLHF